MTNEHNGKTNDAHQPIKLSVAKAISYAEAAIHACAGHSDYQCRKIGYYAVATYFIPQFDFFPGLVIYGPPSTGKTATFSVLNNLCWGVEPMDAETTTDAALRASMNKAWNKTLIIEEADALTTKNLEGTLITRFSTSTGTSKKMKPVGRGWELDEQHTFGATIFHRRNLFRDPALLRRVITVRTLRREKQYQAFPSQHGIYRLFRNALRVIPTLPLVTNEWGIEPGIFDLYRPLVALATYVQDDDFLTQLVAEMKKASTRLRKDETYLEAPTLLKVFPGLVDEATQGKFTLERIGIETRGIHPAILKEFGADCPFLTLSANQRNRIVEEDLGFEVGASHGRSRIYLTIPLLLKKCDEYGVKDDLLEEWRKKLEG